MQIEAPSENTHGILLSRRFDASATTCLQSYWGLQFYLGKNNMEINRAAYDVWEGGGWSWWPCVRVVGVLVVGMFIILAPHGHVKHCVILNPFSTLNPYFRKRVQGFKIRLNPTDLVQ